MHERRREFRKWTKEWAKILLPDGETVLNCTIVNVSPNGACLRIGTATVPDRFYLFRKSDQTLRGAEVRGRRYQTVGVLLGPALDLGTEAAQTILAPLHKRAARAEARRRPVRRLVDHRPAFGAEVDAGVLSGEADTRAP
jgi:hypothetical protein